MAEQIIRNGAIVTDDWIRVADDESFPASGAFVVSYARFAADPDALVDADARVGVLINGENDARALAPYVDRLDAVFVEFPTYADGRGYSHARILRDALGFTGELRAVGDVLRDQMFYMRRVGFDAFEPAPGLSLESAMRGFSDFSVTYQAAADDRRPIYARGLARPDASGASPKSAYDTAESDRATAVGY